VRELSDENQLLLATLPPSRQQIRLALGIVVALFVAFALTAPFADTQLPRADAFIPALETAIVINDLVTCALLFSQFFVVGQTALLVLAISFLFTGLMAIAHMLTFVGADFLPAGPSSASWIGIFWRASFPLAVIAYVLLLGNVDSRASASKRSPIVVIAWSIAATIATACVLTWIATAEDALLPSLMLDSVRVTPGLTYILVFVSVVSLNAIALGLLWVRRRSVLDLWLMVMCCAWMLEIMMSAVLVSNRFTLGWYAGKLFALISTLFVLLALLFEMTALYANLARSVIRQRGAREAGQIGMDAMAASLAHEIKQPLTSIVASADAGLNWLARTPPDLDEARASFESISSDGHRASEVIDGIRSMFKKDLRRRAWLDTNDLVREVLAIVDVELRTQRVSVATELRDGLPQVFADRAQLQQVVLNLIMNAIEAMSSVTDRSRLLRIKSDSVLDTSTVLVTVEDAGTGIGANDKDRIFEPFFTTKSEGTGIGLAVCRRIIESHGGSLWASDNAPYGTVFHLALPIGNA
jgi:signal transduction histidine kinase